MKEKYSKLQCKLFNCTVPYLAHKYTTLVSIMHIRLWKNMVLVYLHYMYMLLDITTLNSISNWKSEFGQHICIFVKAFGSTYLF